MNSWVEWRERVSDIYAGGTTRWYIYIYIYIYIRLTYSQPGFYLGLFEAYRGSSITLKSCDTLKSMSVHDNIYVPLLPPVGCAVKWRIYWLTHTLKFNCSSHELITPVADNVYVKRNTYKIISLRWEWRWLLGRISKWLKASLVSISAWIISCV